MKKRGILIFDIGTSGVKACLFDMAGAVTSSCIAEYPTNYGSGGEVEQNPDDWVASVIKASSQIMKEQEDVFVECIGFSGQMMGLVCIDRDGRAIRPSLIHSDQRSKEEDKIVTRKMDPIDLYRITGHYPSPASPLQKLMWLKRNEPQNYAMTEKVINAKDYVALKLTGTVVTDHSDASFTNMYDIHQRTWSKELCSIGEIDEDKLPDIVDSATVIGTVCADMAKNLGVSSGTPVVIGAGDGPCSSVGCGASAIGKTYNYIGSSSWIVSILKEPAVDPQGRVENGIHPAGNVYHSGGTTQTAGSAIQKMVDILYGGDFQAFENDALKSSLGANSLQFLPYLNGERVPFWDDDIRGTITGISLHTTKADLARAVMEGVALNLKLIMDIMRQHSLVQNVSIFGGVTRSDGFCQILTDCFGLPVVRLANTENITSLGAMVIAGVGIGAYDDYLVAEKMVTVERAFTPNEVLTSFYEEKAKCLEDAYNAIKCYYEQRIF